MDKRKALRRAIRVFTAITLVLLFISLYNLFSFLSSGITGDSFGLKLNRNEVTGDWILALDADPRNNGFLDTSLFFEITILDLDSQRIASNSTSVHIGAGSRQPFSLHITIPASFIPGGEIENAKGYMMMRMSVRTLWGLVGLEQVMDVRGS